MAKRNPNTNGVNTNACEELASTAIRKPRAAGIDVMDSTHTASVGAEAGNSAIFYNLMRHGVATM